MTNFDSQRIKEIRDNTAKIADAFTCIADVLERMADRKTEPNSSEKPNNCDTCRNKGFEGCEQPCLGCGCCGLYEPKDESTISKMEQVEDEPQTKLCRECDDYAGDGMYCASNHIVYDFSTSKGNCEPQKDCNNCKHKGVEGCEQPCLECNGCDLFEPKDEPQTDCPWK